MTTDADPLMGMVPLDVDAAGQRVRFIGAGGARFGESFFHESLVKLAERGDRPVADVTFEQLRGVVGPQTPSPRGLVLHTGRCGSTLLMRMLLHDRTTMPVSEPVPLGIVHRDALAWPDRRRVDEQAFADLLVVLDRFAATRGQRTIVKLSSWQAADSVRVAQLVPDVPIVFVHRAPQEVVASLLDDEPAWMADLRADRPVAAR